MFPVGTQLRLNSQQYYGDLYKRTLQETRRTRPVSTPGGVDTDSGYKSVEIEFPKRVRYCIEFPKRTHYCIEFPKGALLVDIRSWL